MIPGDILGHAGRGRLGAYRGRPDGHYVPWEDGKPTAAAILRAVPYWLPAGAEAAVLDSEPPPDQPRLGAPSAVWLAEPLSIPPVAFPPHLATIADLGSDPDGRHRRRFTAPMERSIRTLRAICEAPGGSRVRGVLLTADRDGTLEDLIGWVIEIPVADDDLRRSRQIMFARRSLTAWLSVIDMLAAVVAWGDWTDPVGRVPDKPDRAWLRRLRYGATRRAEQSGEVGGVRVLDVRRRTRPAERSNALGTHASPVTHPRRGHFRRQVHGPRHDPWHETIWVRPTMVKIPASSAPAGSPCGDYRTPRKSWPVSRGPRPDSGAR